MESLLEMSWIQFIVLILASFRLAHLIVFDKITAFLRDQFITVIKEVDAGGKETLKTEIKGEGWRYWVGSLLSCYWCVGVWTSLLVVILYWLFPITFPALLVLAIAGGASIIESKL